MLFQWVFHSSGRGHLYAKSSGGEEKRQTHLSNKNKWKEHDSQVEYRKAHSQQKPNLLSPLAEKPVRELEIFQAGGKRVGRKGNCFSWFSICRTPVHREEKSLLGGEC